MKLNKKFMLLTAIFSTFSYATQAQYISIKDIYGYAKNRNYNALKNLGNAINTKDKNGNTALCLALMNGDTQAYQTLHQYGADTNIKCNITYGMSSGDSPYYGYYPQGEYYPDGDYYPQSQSSGTFLGMGPVGWTVVGVLAIGGGVAAAVAGGGGGGSSSSGSNGGNNSGSKTDIPDIQPSNDPITDVDNGQPIVKKILKDTDKITVQDGDGTEYSVFANNSNLKMVTQSHSPVTGVQMKKIGEAANAFAEDGTQTGEISIEQRGSGDVYGMHADVESASNESDYVDLANAEADKTGKAKAKIEITNLGNGNVYGINAETNGNNVGSVDGAYAEQDSSAESEITISNKGNGNIYGIKADDGIYNASADDNAQATSRVTINNSGNGNIYGLSADFYLTNAEAYGTVRDKNTDAKATGIININSKGTGKAYGMHSSAQPGNFVYNAYAHEGGTATGIIRINNEGSGSAYGMFGHNLESAFSQYPHDSLSALSAGDIDTTIISTINMLNKSNGTVYGMYSGVANNSIKHNSFKTSDVTATSTIELANIGDGLAVGIYSKDGTVENSGKIKIHNLGNGTAVGIYADGATSVKNYGTITIDRTDFKDNMTTDSTSDDKTYKASSAKGGKAVGIYGAADSDITNKGIIKISGATNAYGIYSEGGNITNTGTIMIDGDSNHANKIKLNGGKLFQNGKIIAGADWGDDSSSETDEPITDVDTGKEIIKKSLTKADEVENIGVAGNNANIKAVVDSKSSVIGIDAPDDIEAGNAIGISTNQTGSIDITQRGVGDVYGMRHLDKSGRGTPQDEDDYMSMYNAAGYNATGTIKITDTGGKIVNNNADDNGNIYGMYSDAVYMDLSNALVGDDSLSSHTVRGTIEITARGDNHVHGIYSQGEAVNAEGDAKGHAIGQISITNKGDGEVYGIEAKHVLENAEATDKSKAEATITINNTNHGKGNVYGLFSSWDEVINAKAGHYRDSEKPQDEATAIGTVNINNQSDGNVYGIRAGQDVENAYAYGKSQANGAISIQNIGNGNVYGIWTENNESYGFVTNAEILQQGKGNGSIIISNQGSGDVYGVYARSAYNSDGDEEGSEAKGLISINNIGNGNIFGMYANDYAENAWTGEGTSKGIIRISNNGTGYAYGIYAQQKAKNASKQSFNNIPDSNIGNVVGLISVINQNNGNAYGMWGKEIYNTSFSNYNVSSIIEVANVGDGLAVGMYSKNGTVENSGDIKIHNLGNGTAVGIYADGTTQVVNTGTITIDRANYKDDMATDKTSDDVTYKAKSTKGGKAIGIYGASGSSITNNGTITIKGADLAYGIYSEGNDVTNTGTILIDGQYTENAIRLDGGKLFQNGKMIVNADWEDNGISGSNEAEEFDETPLIGKNANINNDTIALNNSVYRHVYGLYYTDDAYVSNGQINVSGQNAIIDIKNRNNGNVVGVYGGYVTNAEVHNGSGKATVKIDNIGDGFVAGLWGTRILVEDNQEWGVANTDILDDGVSAEALIDIKNRGNGYVLGMSSDVSIGEGDKLLGTAENAYGNSIARINIDNISTSKSALGVIGIQAEDVVNATSFGDHTANGTIYIQNQGYSNVTGISGIDVKNAEVTNTTNATANALIQINNFGVSSVYGIEGLPFATQFADGIIYNAWTDGREADSSATGASSGTIKIVHQGNVSANDDNGIYGIKSEARVRNAEARNIGSATGRIDINNTGDSNVYGIASYSLYNAKSGYRDNNDMSASNLIATGIININNNGNGDVYGLKAESADNAKGDNGIAKGIIRISNKGNGKSYGIWSNGNANTSEMYSYNATINNAYNSCIDADFCNDAPRYASGLISVINQGNGNAYGMFSSTVNNMILNASKSVNNTASESTIELANIGDGLAVGIYSKDGMVENSGDIKIHNLADGTAVGIYADGTTNVTNSGTITIDRESYTDDMTTDDKSDNVTYTAASLTGGKAVGIYGAEDSTINNTGTITINGADLAYGIYSEGHYVNNTGTILIDGQYAGNAIHLNGGQLFQDGVMKVDADWDIDNIFGRETDSDIGKTLDGEVYEHGTFVGCVLVSNNDKIIVNRNSDNTVIGVQSNSHTANASSYKNFKTAYINVKQTGNGDVYGIKAEIKDNWSLLGPSVYNAYTEIGLDSHMTDYTTVSVATGLINILNSGNGNVYGMTASNGNGLANAYAKSNHDTNATATGRIRILNSGHGNTYGMYGNSIYNAAPLFGTESTPDTQFAQATGLINLINKGSGNAYGMYAFGSYASANNISDDNTTSKIEMVNIGNGLAVGMYSNYLDDSFASDDYNMVNSGEIIIHNLADGVAVGMYADGQTFALNSGTITIDRESYTDDKTTEDTSDDVTYRANSEFGGKAIGIYGASDSFIANSGTIIINDAENAYGIWSESGDIDNTGTILINGDAHSDNAIVLNSGQLFQNGQLIVTNNNQNSPMSVASVKPASLNLNDFGGTVVASDTSQFIVEGAISGDLAINNSVIENGFDTTYSVKDMIQAQDTSGLKLYSQSALFDATLKNNTDAVMTMKAFNDVVESDSIADFLQNNYTANNNEDLFKTLKSAETMAQLNSNIDDLFGKNMLSRMAFEDLSMLREVSFDMNNHLFKQEGAFAFGENVSPSSYDNNIGSVGRYALNGYNNGKTSFGLGISITDVRTDDGHRDNRRFDRNFMMSAPIGHKTHGFELITAPKMGYADGTYDRDGFNNMTYEGKIQKRMFALTNEARYPLKFGGMKLIPSAEFNMIGYNIKGHEDEKQYALRIKSQNHYSVEAGFGLMAEKEFKPFKNHKFNVNGGVAVYHEFANPYELEVGMNGMDGYYKLQDERRSDNRTVVRFGFDYELKDNLDVSTSWLTNIDREYRTDANIDLKYHF